MANAPWYSLPLELVDLILDNLSALDLARLAKVGCNCRSAALRKLSRRTPDILLARWFTSDQVATFRQLQGSNGILVSGSAALAFLTPDLFTPGDLDCYVSYPRCFPLVDFLLQCGYRTATSRPSIRLLTSAPTSQHYSNPAIRLVLTFEKKISNAAEKVQLVVTSGSPMEAILRFHSTCVMNFIAHNYAMCLFPSATLIESTTIPLGGSHHLATVSAKSRWESAVSKYERRGWAVKDSEDFTICDALGARTEHSAHPRFAGDSLSLVWRFESSWDDSLPSPMSLDIARGHSWTWEYDDLYSQLDTRPVSTADGALYCISTSAFVRLKKRIYPRSKGKLLCTSKDVENVSSSLSLYTDTFAAAVSDWLAANPMPDGYLCFPSATTGSWMVFVLNHISIGALGCDNRPKILCSWEDRNADMFLVIKLCCEGASRTRWMNIISWESDMIEDLRQGFISVELAPEA